MSALREVSSGILQDFCLALFLFSSIKIFIPLNEDIHDILSKLVGVIKLGMTIGLKKLAGCDGGSNLNIRKCNYVVSLYNLGRRIEKI